MTTIFTKGAVSIVPITITGFSSSRQSGNTIHRIIGASVPDVTMDYAGLRTGTLELVFDDLTKALAAENMFGNIGTVIMSDSDLPQLNMTFVTNGAIAVELHEDRMHWLVRVDYQEVLVA